MLPGRQGYGEEGKRCPERNAGCRCATAKKTAVSQHRTLPVTLDVPSDPRRPPPAPHRPPKRAPVPLQPLGTCRRRGLPSNHRRPWS